MARGSSGAPSFFCCCAPGTWSEQQCVPSAANQASARCCEGGRRRRKRGRSARDVGGQYGRHLRTGAWRRLFVLHRAREAADERRTRLSATLLAAAAARQHSPRDEREGRAHAGMEATVTGRRVRRHRREAREIRHCRITVADAETMQRPSNGRTSGRLFRTRPPVESPVARGAQPTRDWEG